MSFLTEEEQHRFKNDEQCENCEEEFSTLCGNVRIHFHFYCRFRSVICNVCNLKRQNQKCIPIITHNSCNYDSHFIIRQI